jgi:hypothetical protein
MSSTFVPAGSQSRTDSQIVSLFFFILSQAAPACFTGINSPDHLITKYIPQAISAKYPAAAFHAKTVKWGNPKNRCPSRFILTDGPAVTENTYLFPIAEICQYRMEALLYNDLHTPM